MVSLGGIWPLFDLTLRTPRLELHPVRDADLPGLVDAALAGIHDPSRSPFGVPWTDAPREELAGNIARYQWGLRTRVAAGDWHVAFAIVLDGVVVGSQDLSVDGFSTRRTVATGSWLTASAQGRGLGKEMRAAALLFAFDHLGAEYAETSASSWNESSLGVSRALGYTPNGVHRASRRHGQADDEVHYRLAKDDLRRPAWQLHVGGLRPVRGLLSA